MNFAIVRMKPVEISHSGGETFNACDAAASAMIMQVSKAR